MEIDEERAPVERSPFLRAVVIVFALLGLFAFFLLLAGVFGWLSPEKGPPIGPEPLSLDGDILPKVDRNLVDEVGELLPGTTPAERRVEQRDAFLRDRLQLRMIEEESAIVGEFKVDVKEGVAHLYGAVGSEADRQYLADVAASVEGILGVKNNIDIKDIDPAAAR